MNPATERTATDMCGIVGVVAHTPVNQLLYDGLLLLQHRGQDAAGIVTSEGTGLPHAQGPRPGARRVPHAQHARAAGQRRASGTAATRPRARRSAEPRRSRSTSTRRSASRSAHNGNLTNSEALKRELFAARPPPRQHRLRLAKCCSTCSRTSSSAPRSIAGSIPTRSSRRSPACTAAAAAPTRSSR